MTDKIIQNLETLIEAVEAHPEDHFNLSRFKQETECGTLFCTIGLAATMPYFQEQGLELVNITPRFSERQVFDVRINGGHSYEAMLVDPLFGPNAFGRLFDPAGLGSLDEVLGYVDEDELGNTIQPNMTDKELALARLRNQVKLITK